MADSHARIEFDDVSRRAPGVVSALRSLSASAGEAGLEKPMIELVKLRASQLNGCAFCIQFHLNLARKIGVPAEKLDLVPAWREAGLFSAREQAALAWTEVMTRMAPGAASEADYAALRAEFSESEALFLTVAIGTINQWNRIAVAFRFTPPVPKATEASAA
ncbi:alkylhydroperoxidase AhpD family core domain-containing protein [Tistlia consotensis]|uniref:Alkylhydroperoxidase AhpD family core domain-containing protein n=1 Tax=Tistlia consotensis USBA 355 TaxID=560819 RepID=A0A1Y6C6D0_9PROT|nr:carboxymuconolactone decarboxylase family protein [Tistlia consotensis]SMF47937.1 alkylhydroperoxidase AhpD family core domain-containing protein [Tistlia consotensis USBA 355]SNR82078.1 alkylhydroperoxidase AhpD family core domain-containing protein [Tistlia consotensis]